MPDSLPGADSLPSSAIGRFYAYRATQRAGFTVPIFVLFFTSRGLSLADVGAVEALFTVVVLFAETPTGYLGDRLGRRGGLAVGTLLSAAGAAAFTLAHSFAAFAAVIALRGVATTFRSGTQGAWLYETLADDGDAADFAHHAGRARAVGLVVHGATVLVGSWLYARSHVLPWLAEAGVVAAGVLVLLTVPEPSGTAENEGVGFGDALSLARTALSTRRLAAFLALTGLLFGLLNTLQIFVQPVAVDVAGVPPARLGLLYAGFTAVGAVVSTRTGWLEERVGVRRWFALAPVALGAALVGVAVAPALALPAFVLSHAVGRASRPLSGQFLNDRTDDAGRATTLSAASTLRSAATAPLNVLGGALATAVALPTALGLLGGLLLVGTACCLVAWPE